MTPTLPNTLALLSNFIVPPIGIQTIEHQLDTYQGDYRD